MDHFLVHPFVEDPLLQLVLNVLNALLKIRVLFYLLKCVVVCNEEIVLVGSVEMALVLVIELNL